MRHTDSPTRESGYVLATTALLLIPLMIFAAFAVDVGAWYVSADQAQRAADAAALSAVVRLPNQEDAWDAARDIAASNGLAIAEDNLVAGNAAFDAGNVPAMKLTVGQDQSVQIRFRVAGETYFGKVVLSDIDIERFASANYRLPVPMGSPYNILGFGAQTLDSEPTSNIQLLIGGYCSPARFGDMRAAYFLRNGGCTITNDTAAERDESYAKKIADFQAAANPDWEVNNGDGNPGIDIPPRHDRSGYRYVVDIPNGVTQPVDVMVFDAPYCRGGTSANGWIRDTGSGGNNDRRTLLAFKVFNATDTPLDDSDIVEITAPSGGFTVDADGFRRPGLAAPIGSSPDYSAMSAADRAKCEQWQRIVQIPVPAGGHPLTGSRYYIDVSVDESWHGGFTRNTNFFALWAGPTGTQGTTCDRTVTPTCIGIYAQERLPVRAAIGSVAVRFPLAEIEASNEGKVLEVSMWDPGEGMDYVQILDESDQELDFTWTVAERPGRTIFGSTPNPSQTCASGSASRCLSVRDEDDSTPPIISGWEPTYTAADFADNGDRWPSGQGRFDGRWVTLRVPLSDPQQGLTIDYGWFTVRYVPTGGSLADLTTWSVRVIGDPVRLTE